jgi:hypothetical protein
MHGGCGTRVVNSRRKTAMHARPIGQWLAVSDSRAARYPLVVTLAALSNGAPDPRLRPSVGGSQAENILLQMTRQT